MSFHGGWNEAYLYGAHRERSEHAFPKETKLTSTTCGGPPRRERSEHVRACTLLPQGDGFKRQITNAGSYRHAFACHFPPGGKLRERKTTLRSCWRNPYALPTANHPGGGGFLGSLQRNNNASFRQQQERFQSCPPCVKGGGPLCGGGIVLSQVAVECICMGRIESEANMRFATDGDGGQGVPHSECRELWGFPGDKQPALRLVCVILRWMKWRFI